MPSSFEDLLLLQLGANTAQDYLIAVGVFVATLLVLKIFRRLLLVKMHAFAEKTKVQIDDLIIGVLEGVSSLFYFVVAFFLAAQYLSLPRSVDVTIKTVVSLVLVYEVIKLIEQLISFVIAQHFEKANGEEKKKKEKMSRVLTIVIRFVLWIVGFLLILSNIGVNVNSLIASLGIGGIAIALAVQNVLGDLFSAFAIAFDKPFEEGDYIVVGDYKGTVKHIGLKTTRLQALQGEEIIISNAELTSARVQNFKNTKKRRAAFSFGLAYETPLKKLKEVPGIVQEVIESCSDVEFDRAHFKEFGDFSLNFEVVYFVTTRDYLVYMDTQQKINVGILERFEKEGIEMAYPTQTLFIKKE